MILSHLNHLTSTFYAAHQHVAYWLHATYQHGNHTQHPLSPFNHLATTPKGQGQQQQNQQGQNQGTATGTGTIDVATSLKNIVIELGTLFGVGLLALAILKASIMTMFAGESPDAESRSMRAFGLAFIGFLGVVGAVGIAMAINGQIK
jgi:hypothetical protein